MLKKKKRNVEDIQNRREKYKMLKKKKGKGEDIQNRRGKY